MLGGLFEIVGNKTQGSVFSASCPENTYINKISTVSKKTPSTEASYGRNHINMLCSECSDGTKLPCVGDESLKTAEPNSVVKYVKNTTEPIDKLAVYYDDEGIMGLEESGASEVAARKAISNDIPVGTGVNQECPANQHLIGVEGRASNEIDSVGFVCSNEPVSWWASLTPEAKRGILWIIFIFIFVVIIGTVINVIILKNKAKREASSLDLNDG